jgi:hypothetical protein
LREDNRCDLRFAIADLRFYFCFSLQPQSEPQEFLGEKDFAFSRKFLPIKNIAKAINIKTIAKNAWRGSGWCAC